MRLVVIFTVVVAALEALPINGQARFMFKGVEVPEHSLVVRETIGSANDDTLMCESDYSDCCTDPENFWHRDFSTSSGGLVGTDTGSGVYQTRDTGVVRLHYNGGNPDGIFFCQIRASASELQTLYVGVYPSVDDNRPPSGINGDGTVTVDCTAGTPFSLTTGPEAEVPEFTLSCTSSGGPVREFNCTSPDGGNVAGVASLRTPEDETNRDQGLYDHSVNVTGNYPGAYTCQVTVYRYDGTAPEPETLVYPETPGAAQTITVTAAAPPTGLSATQVGTTISVSWSPPSSTSYGYRIYYQAEGDPGPPPFVVVTGGSTTSHDLTVQSSVSYTISIQTLSSTELPSSVTVGVSTTTGISLEFTTSGSTTAGSTDYSVTCTVTIAGLTGTPSITWKDPGGTMISTGSDFTVGGVTGPGPTYSSVLMFPSLKTSQAGVYTCNATLDSVTSMSTTPVSVTIPPPSVAVTPAPDRTLYNGESVNLTCTITLDPAVDSVVAVTASWAGPGGAITDGVSGVTGSGSYQSTLTLSSLMTSGDYTCTACVGTSTPQVVVASEDGTDTHTITVEDYNVSISNRIGTAALGGTYSLTCTVEGVSDSPTIQWFGPGGSEITTGVSTTTLTSTLTFMDLALSDAGDYTCRSTISEVEREVVETVMPQILPAVTLLHDGGSGTIYAGSVLTLSCSITLPSEIIDDLTVTSSWTVQGGGGVTGDSRVTVQPATRVSGTLVFLSTVQFNTLRTSDSDTYTCTITITPSPSLSLSEGQVSKATTINVVNPTIDVTVEANTTRLPIEPPYNTFTILCTASAPVGVIAAKTITWRRRIGSSTTGLGDVIANGGTILIESSNLTQAESTSLLTVTEDTAGDYRYRCRVAITDLGISLVDADVYPINVIGQTAPSFTELTATNVQYDRATIQWTVPVVAYTPETYVVNYGTNMSTLNSTSEAVPSGSDFEAMDLTFLVLITDLGSNVVYYYQLVATNTFASTSSDVMSFTTLEQVPDPPRNFTVTALGTDTLQFSWDPPDISNGEPQTYRLSCDSTFPTEQEDVLVKVYALDGSNRTMPVMDTQSVFSAGVTYLCSVVSSNSAGDGNPVIQVVTTLAGVPTGQPQSFEITADNATVLTFSWMAIAPGQRNGNITSYTLTCEPTISIPPVLPATDLSITVEGLTPNTIYTCQVLGRNSAGEGPPASNTTQTPEDAPGGPPLNIVATPDTPVSVEFSWDPPSAPNGRIMYLVECTSEDDGVTSPVMNMTMEQATPLIGFTPAAAYSCVLTAYTNAGPGPNATIEVVTLPEAPVITNVTALSSTHLMVNFDPPERSGLVTQYTVYLNRSACEPGEVSYETAGPELSLEVGPICPYEEVRVQVSATTAGGEGPRSDDVQGRTLEDQPGPVAIVRWLPQPDDPSIVIIEWEDPERPNGVLTQFIIKLLSYSSNTLIQSFSVDNTTVHAVTFNNAELVAGVPFNFVVIAVNSAGVGEEMVFTNFTKVLPALPPEGVSVERSSDGSEMTISWIPLSLVKARGFVQYYVITISGGGSSTKRELGGGCTVANGTCLAPAASDSLTVTGLDPRTGYVVTVAAANGIRSPPIVPQPDDSLVGVSSEELIIPPTVTETGGSSGGDNTGVIIAVVVILLAVGAAIVIVIVLVVLYRRRKHPKRGVYSPSRSKEEVSFMGESEGTDKPTLSQSARKSFMNSETELDTFDPSKCPTPAADGHVLDRLKAVPVTSFTEHVQGMHEDRDKGFELEYQSISNEPLASYSAAKIPSNKAKNRFANIFPYDFCRVKMQEIPGEKGSEYINASYMDGYKHQDAYIAAQGPMPNTINDFWRMIWEKKLVTVVMLTRCTEAGKRKCEQYWPEGVNETMEVGNNLSVTLTSAMPYADYEIKQLSIQDTSKPDSAPLIITHYHFLGWPDHGVPKFATSLIAFIRRVRKAHTKDGPPMLVHCSAGVGRTGTFILLDSMLERMKEEGSVNVYEFLRDMRAKRVFMVQTLLQYVFIHDALDELIRCGETDISATNLRVRLQKMHKINPQTTCSRFEEQFRLLEQVSRKPNDADCSDALQLYNNQKNRYPDRVPYNLSRARLRPTGATGGEYINGSFVDGYKRRNAYIAAQAPLEATVNDFWRMMWEFKSKCIVMLCDLEENGQESSYQYWPSENGQTQLYGKLLVNRKSEVEGKDFITRKFDIKEEKPQQVGGQNTGFEVTMLHYLQWPEHGRPPSSRSVLQMLNELVRVQRNSGNRVITVVCNDGMGRTGTFLCIHAQLERVKTEGVVDIFQFIKSSRIHRPSLVSDREQYIFCHDVVADYLDSFDTYANFKDLGAQ